VIFPADGCEPKLAKITWVFGTFGEAPLKALIFQTLLWDGLLGVISPVNSFKPKRSVKKHHQKRRRPDLLYAGGEFRRLTCTSPQAVAYHGP
jgi:hypothetical protein